MASPSGTLVHSLGHNTLGKADIAVQTIFLAICFVAVALRLWSRRLQWISPQLNDGLIIGATFLVIGRYVVEIILIVMCGLGLHSTEVTQLGGAGMMIRFIELTYAGDLLWVTVVFLIQLSILHYYVCNFGQRTITLLAYIIMGLCLALWVASFCVTAFFCKPPKRLWLDDAPSHWGGRKTLHIAIKASEIFLSFLTLVLPIPLTWRMPLSRARKFGLVGIQTLGVVVIVIIAISMKLDLDLGSDDPSHASAKKSLLTCIAPLLGIIVACLPILSPAIQGIFGTTVFSSAPQYPDSDPHVSRYWNPVVLSGVRLEEPEMPLVTVHQPFMAKADYLAPGHIRVTSDWEIHSSRGSAILDRSHVRRG